MCVCVCVNGVFFPKWKEIDCRTLWQRRTTGHSKVSWQRGNNWAPPLFSAASRYLPSVCSLDKHVSQCGGLCRPPLVSQPPPPTNHVFLLTGKCQLTMLMTRFSCASRLLAKLRIIKNLFDFFILFSALKESVLIFIHAQVCFSCVESYMMVWQKKKKTPLWAKHHPFRSWTQCQAS